MQLSWHGAKSQRDYAFDFEAKWVRNRILAYKIEEWSKVAHLETLERHLFASAWESSASQTLKDWRLERKIWAPESWAVSGQERVVAEPKYRRSGMTIGSVGSARSSSRDKTASAGIAKKGLGKTWCCCFAEVRILVLADVRSAWNVFEADG